MPKRRRARACRSPPTIMVTASYQIHGNEPPAGGFRGLRAWRPGVPSPTIPAGALGSGKPEPQGTMMAAVNAGARLDRLPISSFHYRIFFLVGAGMFFDGYDLYVAGGVLAATLQSKFSTIPENLRFISITFVGMTIGSLVTGFLGDHFGRRFTYQFNLLIFGLASLAAAFAQDMTQLIVCRFVQGLGLGAEIVVGYSTLTEFVPPRTRGRWLAFMSFLVVTGLPVTSILSYLIIPTWGWRPLFVIAGIGSLIVWYLRKALPESPRWLESQGRLDEAEALVSGIEKEVARTATL